MHVRYGNGNKGRLCKLTLKDALCVPSFKQNMSVQSINKESVNFGLECAKLVQCLKLKRKENYTTEIV